MIIKRFLSPSASELVRLSFAALASLFTIFGCSNRPVDHGFAAGNHLKGQTSPYVLSHAADPVYWYPWCDEAFERAKKENKPVFLSSGFAACHWCHVMQHESFQNSDTAKVLNDNFICVLVDREERPDVDEIYTRAAQVIGGSGGWPLCVFLTPDKKPFFAGTYFPATEKFGLPGFTTVLKGVLDNYRNHRGDIDKMANKICRDIYDLDGGRGKNLPDQTMLLADAAKMLRNFDDDWGGMVGQRKFVRPGTLDFALRVVAAEPADRRPLEKAPYLTFIRTTLNRVMYGGIHDHLRGGFFRFTTDSQWKMPHFEKMLTDNALLSKIYIQAGLLNQNASWKNVGLQTLDFCLETFAAPGGGFYGSLDADSGGEEGGYYKFSARDIEESLGSADAAVFTRAYGISDKAASALYLTASEEKLAESEGLSLAKWREKMQVLRDRVLQSKVVKDRPAPLMDKKIIAGWNGLMISALVQGYKASGEPRYRDAAEKNAVFILEKLCRGNTLQRIWNGKAEIAGCLDDYAYMIQALLDLASVDSDPRWLKTAMDLNNTVTSHFFSHHVGFYYTANNKEQALMRVGCASDTGGLSPFAVQIDNLSRLYAITGDDRMRVMQERTLKLYPETIAEDPASYGSLLAAMQGFLHKSDRLIVVQGQDKELAQKLISVPWSFYAPYLVSLLALPQELAELDKVSVGKVSAASGAGSSKSVAYFCHGQTKTCDAPISDPALLKKKIENLVQNGH